MEFFQVQPGARCCKECGVVIKFTNNHSFLSRLRNHVTGKHHKLLQAETDPRPSKTSKIDEMFSRYATQNEGQLPQLSASEREVIASCACRHVLPFNLVEDRIFQWAYNPQIRDHKKLKGVVKMANEWRQRLADSIRGTFVTLTLDGWTDPISRIKHVCFLLQKSDGSCYCWSSRMVTNNANDTLLSEMQQVHCF